jgi:hypothetical protein
MMLALLFIVVVGGVVGRTIFREVDLKDAAGGDGEKYFGSVGRSMWNVFVAITSSSFPDQIVACYEASRPSMMFFFLAISAGAFLYLNVLQVVVFTSFEFGRNLVNQRRTVATEESLQKAFLALDVHNVGYLTHSQIKDVLDELYENYFAFRKFGVPSVRERTLLIRAMDTNSDGKVYKDTFMLILELSRITVHEEVRSQFSQPTLVTRVTSYSLTCAERHHESNIVCRWKDTT